jgi:hypothetical protein
LVHFSLFPFFGIGFSIEQPVWIRLAGMLEAHGSLLFSRQGVEFLAWRVLQQRRAAQAEAKALFQG